MALLLAACEAALPSSPPPKDLPPASDVAAAVDLVLLPDANVLEQVVSPDALEEAAEDAPAVEPDAAVHDQEPAGDAVGGDPSALDATPETAADAPATDGPAPEDTPPDKPLPIGCGPAPQPCPPDQACEDLNGDGLFGCVSVSDCSPSGAIELDSLDAVKDMLMTLLAAGKVYVKVESKVFMGPASCGMQPCADATPCCNQCVAHLFAGVPELGIILNGKGVAIGCKGSDCQLANGCLAEKGCDVAKVCAPIIPGKYYWIWGEVGLVGGQPEFHVDGFCLAK
jgi:hypothetical protein